MFPLAKKEAEQVSCEILSNWFYFKKLELFFWKPLREEGLPGIPGLLLNTFLRYFGFCCNNGGKFVVEFRLIRTIVSCEIAVLDERSGM